jgi:hypothetical protein
MRAGICVQTSLLCDHALTTSLYDQNSALDLGAARRLIVNHYALRHGWDEGLCCLRDWELQGSNNGAEWTTLRRHDNDETMEQKAFFVAHWAVEGVTTAYHHFRVRSHGPDSGGQNYLMCAGIELYGTLTEDSKVQLYLRSWLDSPPL